LEMREIPTPGCHGGKKTSKLRKKKNSINVAWKEDARGRKVATPKKAEFETQVAMKPKGAGEQGKSKVGERKPWE